MLLMEGERMKGFGFVGKQVDSLSNTVRLDGM